MRILERIFLTLSIVLLFAMIIYFFAVGIWERQALLPIGKYISSSPEYFYLQSIMIALVGGVVVSGLSWILLWAKRISK